ncbi:hypothetical protein DESME_04325 [Desulfitobacterium metallireducens DSM 15288]|uniref:Uncharacterized protein n=1 Tax=Desulfitobacterium metallireducens DSM 15288 TaxID=871968 RepID=W0EHB8_9FIRM|nr:hypothetical protein DESME_04325 [Desulfitobacterium metallireducens DSM 15288]
MNNVAAPCASTKAKYVKSRLGDTPNREEVIG